MFRSTCKGREPRGRRIFCRFRKMSKFCDFNDDGATICDIAISRPDVSRRLTEHLTRPVLQERYRWNDGGRQRERERKREKRVIMFITTTSRISRHQGAPCIVTASAKRWHGGAFIRGKSEVWIYFCWPAAMPESPSPPVEPVATRYKYHFCIETFACPYPIRPADPGRHRPRFSPSTFPAQ